MKIIAGSLYSTVLQVRDHAPGTHPTSPIRNDMPAREWVTARGSRWSGIRANGSLVCDPTAGPTAVAFGDCVLADLV